MVYCEAASVVIKYDQDLDILCNVFSPQRMRDLPSWVPDWRTGWGIHRYFLRRPDIPSDAWELGGTFYTRGRSLFTKGKVVDTITHCAWPLMIYDQDPEAYLQEVWHAIAKSSNETVRKIFQQWYDCSRRLRSYPTGESVLEAFERTIIPDEEPGQHWAKELARDLPKQRSSTRRGKSAQRR